MHRTPVSGKYMYDYGPNETCLDNNLLLLHFLRFCVGDGLRQQCSITTANFAFLEKPSNIFVQRDDEVMWTGE